VTNGASTQPASVRPSWYRRGVGKIMGSTGFPTVLFLKFATPVLLLLAVIVTLLVYGGRAIANRLT